MPATSVGPYRVLEHLGAGANGAVFLAEDVRLQRRVALKTVPVPAGPESDARRARVLREARAAARLNHPGIAAVHDVIDAEREVHIVMEHVRGSTLAARVRSGPLPPMQVLDLGLQVAHALAHAHAMGVIHRDLKPANIMLTPQGEAKILDFGLARLCEAEVDSVALSASGSATFDGRVAGTPPYIPPEVLRGEAAEARGDVYSLGVTLFELLTGRRPFDASGGQALTSAILGAPTPRPRSVSAEVPAALDEIVYRAMARDPGQRYASAAALAADLDRVRSAITDPSTQSASAPPRAGRSRRLAVAAIVAAAIAVGGAALAVRARPVPAAGGDGHAIVAVLALDAVNDDPVERSVAAGVADSLTNALARVPGFTVVRGTFLEGETPEAAARRLGVTRLVGGTVARAGAGVRVEVAVSGAGSPAPAWSEGFEGAAADVFPLQGRVVAGVLEGLGARAAQAPLEPPTRDTEAHADYLQARAFLERSDVKGNLDRSIALFESALRRDPAFVRAHAGLGEACWRKYLETTDKTWSVRAREATLEALRIDPQDAQVRFTLAVIYKATGRAAEALQEARRALALQPRNDEAHRLLGEMLAASGDLEGGLASVRAAIDLRPQYWRHHFALGMLLYDAVRYQDALAPFRRVTELQPDSGWGYQMLGTCHHALGDRAAARREYQRAAELGDARAWSNLGTLHYEDGDFADAARAFERARDLEPWSPLKHRNVGDVYARMGDSGRARAAWQKAAELTRGQLETNPNDHLIRARLAVYEAKLGRHEEAARLAGEARAAVPGNPEITYRVAVVYALGGRPDDALRTLREAVRQGYSASFIPGDDDLASLRKRAEFQEIVQSAG